MYVNAVTHVNFSEGIARASVRSFLFVRYGSIHGERMEVVSIYYTDLVVSFVLSFEINY